jgi:hypothetical protein
MEIKRGVKIWAIYGPADFRKQITGLTNVVLLFDEKKLDPYNGNYYVFCNRARTAIKILYYHNKGFCLWHKKYKKQYYWQTFKEGFVQITKYELEYILDGKNIWNKKKFSEKQNNDEYEEEVAKSEKESTKLEKRKGGYNKIMIRPFPDKITLDNVIKERETYFDQIIITGFINEDGAGTFYIDRKGLVHRNGPKGEIVSFVGWTNEQMRKAKDDNEGFAPMPR